MQGPTDERQRSNDLWMVERAVVLQILRDDHEERWARAELAREIPDFAPAVLDEALTHLDRDGVLHREESSVWASRAARRLDALELISI
jgi:DNA-binding HxlR family transcriptional regulator